MSFRTLRRHRFGRTPIAAALVAGVPVGGSDAQIIDQSSIVLPARQVPDDRPPSAFNRERVVPVLDRRYPAFEAHGIVIGAFEVFPALEVGPEFTSNTFAVTKGARSSVSIVERTEVTVRNRGGGFDLSFYGRGRFAQNTRFDSESTTEGVGGVDLSIPVGSLSEIVAGASLAANVIPRYAPDSAASKRPMRYREIDSHIGTTVERGRLRIIGRGDLVDLQYRNATALDGSRLSAKERDRIVLSGLVRVEYAVKPDVSVYAAGTVSDIHFDLKPPQVPLNRNSTGWGAFLGANFVVTTLLRGDIRVGYIRQVFNSPAFRPVRGLGLRGTLRYFPTGLDTVTLRGERSVQDSGVPGTAGLVHSGGELQVDHELRRYLVASLIGSRYEDSFRGLPRQDRDTMAALSATYLSGHHWKAKIGYQFMRRHSSGADASPDFDDHRTIATLTFQL